jgi:hypothetical protein
VLVLTISEHVADLLEMIRRFKSDKAVIPPISRLASIPVLFIIILVFAFAICSGSLGILKIDSSGSSSASASTFLTQV